MFHPAKLLLFGEYSVLKGSRALATPLNAFRGSWKYSIQPHLQHDLIQLGQYLKEKVENADAFLNTEKSTSSLWDQFDNYFSGRYEITKTVGKTKTWKAKDGIFIKLMDVSEGKDFGLQIKMGPDAAKNQ